MTLLRPLLLVCLLLLSACSSRMPVANGIPSPAPDGTTPAQAVPSPSPQPAKAVPPAPTPTPQDPEQLAAQLRQLLVDHLRATASPRRDSATPFRGIDDIQVFPLPGEPGQWLAYSTGVRSYDPPQNHFIALYTRRSGDWHELSRLELSSPDDLARQSVQPAYLSAGVTWLAIMGTAGAHSGCFDLARIEGDRLVGALNYCSPHHTAAELIDLDQDGDQEVVLDHTDDYIFSYDCGVSLPRYGVYDAIGSSLRPVTFTRLDDAHEQEAARLNDQAIDLAQAGLWKDAQAAIHGAARSAPGDERITWNAAIIELHAARLAQAIPGSTFPLLAEVFYGDWQAAAARLRAYPPAELFSLPGPLMAGTPAEGRASQLKGWIDGAAGQALSISPGLADAYLVRAWASFVSEPNSRAARADLAQAAALAPQDAFLAACRDYLRFRVFP